MESGDVIIESIFENREAKRELFERINKKARRSALLATNTSAIPLAELADVLDDPGRLVGLHFFNPVAKMPLVEVVHDNQRTGPELVSKVVRFAVPVAQYALPGNSP